MERQGGMSPCIRIRNGIVCIAGPVHSGTDNSDRTWRWTLHKYMGPTWIDSHGNDRTCPINQRHPFWQAFNKWSEKQPKQTRVSV